MLTAYRNKQTQEIIMACPMTAGEFKTEIDTADHPIAGKGHSEPAAHEWGYLAEWCCLLAYPAPNASVASWIDKDTFELAFEAIPTLSE